MSDLVNYGIGNEDSDVRIHVSVVNRKAYVFKTEEGRKAIQKYNPPSKSVTQPGVNCITATGRLVRPDQIDDCRVVSLWPEEWPGWKQMEQSEKEDTSWKGQFAVGIVKAALKCGLIPLWHNVKEATQVAEQIGGTDIIVVAGCKIQVKCDWRAGERPAGTGNLFLQESECNPLKKW